MMVMATSTFATARTLELLTSSGLSGWNVDKGSWANLHHEASGFDSIWFFPNDPNRESWSTLSQTVNLPDFGIVPGSGLSVSASVGSPYGPIVSEWDWNAEKTQLTVKVQIPANTKSTVILPCSSEQKCEVKKGSEGASPTDGKPNTVAYELGSGEYVFVVSSK